MVSSARRAETALDAQNFFLADVRDGLGPYLAIYLLTVRGWDEASIGVVMSIAALAGIAAQTPAGAFIDRTRHKRWLVIAAALIVASTCALLPWLGSFAAIAFSQVLAGAAGAVFQPALAALALGVVGTRAFARRNGRSEAFNHAGNAFAALAAGVLAFRVGASAMFVLMVAMALASVIATLALPESAIDHAGARGLDDGRAEGARTPDRIPHTDEAETEPVGVWALFRSRPLRLFAGCVVLFHFSNAAMLPLVGQKLALGDRSAATTLMSSCILIAQLVMVPVAWWTGARAERWGRKPLFLLALLALPLRGLLFTLSDAPAWLLSVQALDGIGAGIYGAMFPLVVADLTRGSGRFNVTIGAITTALGVGAALSTSVAGWLASRAGYHTAFAALAGVGALALVAYARWMPETAARAGSLSPRLP
jgi:MFS family permease